MGILRAFITIRYPRDKTHPQKERGRELRAIVLEYCDRTAALEDPALGERVRDNIRRYVISEMAWVTLVKRSVIKSRYKFGAVAIVKGLKMSIPTYYNGLLAGNNLLGLVRPRILRRFFAHYGKFCTIFTSAHISAQYHVPSTYSNIRLCPGCPATFGKCGRLKTLEFKHTGRKMYSAPSTHLRRRNPSSV